MFAFFLRVFSKTSIVEIDKNSEQFSKEENE